MDDYRLSNKQIKKLKEFHRTLRDKRQADRVKRQADRVKAVVLLGSGWTPQLVAEALFYGRQVDNFQKTGQLSTRCFAQYPYNEPLRRSGRLRFDALNDYSDQSASGFSSIIQNNTTHFTASLRRAL